MVVLVLVLLALLSLLLEILPLLVTAASAILRFPQDFKPVQKQRDLVLLHDLEEAAQVQRKEQVRKLRESVETQHGVAYYLGAPIGDSKSRGGVLDSSIRLKWRWPGWCFLQPR